MERLEDDMLNDDFQLSTSNLYTTLTSTISIHQIKLQNDNCATVSGASSAAHRLPINDEWVSNFSCE